MLVLVKNDNELELWPTTRDVILFEEDFSNLLIVFSFSYVLRKRIKGTLQLEAYAE